HLGGQRRAALGERAQRLGQDRLRAAAHAEQQVVHLAEEGLDGPGHGSGSSARRAGPGRARIPLVPLLSFGPLVPFIRNGRSGTPPSPARRAGPGRARIPLVPLLSFGPLVPLVPFIRSGRSGTPPSPASPASRTSGAWRRT